MDSRASMLDSIRAALHREPRLGTGFRADRLDIDVEGTVTAEAEVDSVAAKRSALERIAATAGVTGIIDRIRVKPAAPMSDDGIRDHLRKAYIQEPEFRRLRILERVDDELRLVRDALPDSGAGEIEIEVLEGIVTLNGAVPGLASKRLAGLLAWWVPGSRDVINGIAVEPPEEDAPIRIEEAVRIALDKDPFVDAAQIRVGARRRTVRLTGLVHTDAMRKAAEADAWYVFGVDNVINEIAVWP
jgi:osmotically-inducible protein OsmY